MTVDQSEVIDALRDVSTQIASYAARVESLETTAATLGKEDARLDRRGKRNRFWIVVSGVGLVLDLALSGLFVNLYLHQRDTNDYLACRRTLVSKIQETRDRDSDALNKLVSDAFTGKLQDPKVAAKEGNDYLALVNRDNKIRTQLTDSSGCTSTP